MIKKKILQFIWVSSVFTPLLAVAEPLLFQGPEATGQSSYAILEASPDSSTLFAINNSASPGVERFTVSDDGTLVSDFAVDTGKPELQGASTIAFNSDADVLLLGNDSAGARLGLYAYSVGAAGNGFDNVDFYASGGGAAEAGLFDDINVSAVTTSPDGNNIYVAGNVIGSNEGVVAVLSGLDYLSNPGQIQYTALTGAAGERILAGSIAAALDGPVGIAATSDGVYVISSNAGANGELVYFTRAANGALTYNSVVAATPPALPLADPVDIQVIEINSTANVFVADSVAGSIFQFKQTLNGVQPALEAVYDQAVLGGVSKLALSINRTTIYAAATNTITPFYIDTDTGQLAEVTSSNPATDGLSTSGGLLIQGITGVDLLAFGANDEYLYATRSNVGGLPQLAKFSRQSNLSLQVNGFNGSRVQPGQLVAFNVVLSNDLGPADAPRFQLAISLSHSLVGFEVDADSAGFGSCEVSAGASPTALLCDGSSLPVDGDFTVKVIMRPSQITTASVSARAASGNQIANAAILANPTDYITIVSGPAATASGSINVGSPNNGTLAMGLWAHLLLLMLFTLRRFKAAQ